MQNLDVPDVKDSYQVAQLYIGIDRQPWIIGRAGDRKYSKLIEDILRAKDIPVTWEEQNFLEERVQVPSLQGSNGKYNVVGIGNCIKSGDVYHFIDVDSWTYNKKIDEDHLKDFQRLNPDFKCKIYRQMPPKPQPLRNFRLVRGNIL